MDTRASAIALSGLLLAGLAPPAAAEVPDFYRSVASVHWVVADLGAVEQAWGKVGVPPLQDFGEVEIQVKYRGEWRTSRIRAAVASFGGLEVKWIQPVAGENAFQDFLARHGSGIMSLNHRVPSRAALDAELARLSGLGVPILQRADIDTGQGELTIVHMDTEADGKFVLGFVHGSVPGAPTGPPAASPDLRLSQYAMVVRDLKPVSAFWQKVGWPEMAVTHDLIRDRRYRGEAGTFDQELGWHRHGTVTYEWIRSLRGPTVYDEFLKAHGEGVHHLAVDVPDMDAALARWASQGFKAAQSGAWGVPGKPGSGRYAYVDTEPVGGVFVELLSSEK
jgi:hypothetical protein